MDRIECQWCRAQNQTGRTNCTTCGAPLDTKDLVTDSGWAEAPRLRDMTEFRFSNSTCQIAGEVVVLPLHPSMELDVREHAFLAGTHSLTYSFVRIKGLANVLHGGGSMYMDRFVTHQEPGLLLLHGYGNVFQKMLQPDEKIMVEPGGFLYKDSSVTMNAVKQNVKTGLLGGHSMYLAEMTGPGRVGIQSMYVHHGSE